MASPTSPSDESMDELRTLVRKGRLFDVQTWIAAGKPIYSDERRKKNALEAAVEGGFHSMVDLLAQAWTDQKTLDKALQQAVRNRRVDLAWLLMERGADFKTVPLWLVAECCDKELMRYYLDRWDAVGTKGGLTEIVVAMPRPLIGLIKEYAPRLPDSKVQLGAALSQFIHDGHLKWVALAVWMGADPRLPAPTPWDDEEDPPEEWITPMEFAVMKDSLDALKILKPSAKQDDMNALFTRVSLWRREGHEVVEYLLEIGANINNKPNGGSSVLDQVLRPHYTLGMHGSSRGPANTYQLGQWVERGARWVPDTDYELRIARESLYGLSAHEMKQAMKTLAKATSPELLLKLFNTPKLRGQLGYKPPKLEEKVDELYHPREETVQGTNLSFIIPTETTFKQVKPHLVEAKTSVLSRVELYEAIWTDSAVTQAKRFGISDVGLAKICKSYKIPRPALGYWAKRRNGHKTTKKRLPQPDWNPEVEIRSYCGVPPIRDETLRSQVFALIERLSAPGLTIEVPASPAPLHPLIEQARAQAESGAAPGNRPLVDLGAPIDFYRQEDGAPLLALQDRAYRLLSALLRFLEPHGFETGLVPDGYSVGCLFASRFGQQVRFRLSREGGGCACGSLAGLPQCRQPGAMPRGDV